MSGRHAALPVDGDPHEVLADPAPTLPVMLTVVSGRPTDDELAAITAVLAAGEAAAAAQQATLLVPQPESAWTRSRRRPRGPLTVGPGHWRSFSG